MMKREIEVAIALVHRDDKWLIARRPHGVHLGGLWEFPGGKREPFESLTHTALRELREECGVEGRFESTLPTLRHEYDDRLIVLTPIVCAWNSGEPHPIGCDECRWATIEEVVAAEMPELNTEIVAVLRAYLAGMQ